LEAERDTVEGEGRRGRRRRRRRRRSCLEGKLRQSTCFICYCLSIHFQIYLKKKKRKEKKRKEKKRKEKIISASLG
jgi:hypothetical protein